MFDVQDDLEVLNCSPQLQSSSSLGMRRIDKALLEDKQYVSWELLEIGRGVRESSQTESETLVFIYITMKHFHKHLVHIQLAILIIQSLLFARTYTSLTAPLIMCKLVLHEANSLRSSSDHGIGGGLAP